MTTVKLNSVITPFDHLIKDISIYLDKPPLLKAYVMCVFYFSHHKSTMCTAYAFH
jgi:hypothetical protein